MAAIAQPESAPPPCAAKETAAPAQEQPQCKSGPPFFKPITWGCQDEWKLQFSGETRLRLEHRDNMDLDKKYDDDDGLAFMRTKLNFDLSYREFMRAFVQIMDARAFDAGFEYLQEDHFDLHQAFLELKDPCGSGWSTRIGRQEIAFGEERLVGAEQWRNLIPAFDGITATYNSPDLDMTLFAVQPVRYRYLRDGQMLTGNAQRTDDRWVYGIYPTIKCLAPHIFDLYFIGLRDNETNRTVPSIPASEEGLYGTQDRYTVGTRWRGPIAKVDGCGAFGYGLEWASQFGHTSSDDIRAHLLHADLNWMGEHPWKPFVVLEYNWATGDKNNQDGTSHRFDPLYGSADIPLGITDYMAPVNLRELCMRASIEPCPKWKFQLEYHHFNLDRKSDVWVNGDQNFMAIDPTGRSGRHVGQEVDLIAYYKCNDWLTYEAGAGHFFPGNYADHVGRGDSSNFCYLQAVLKF